MERPGIKKKMENVHGGNVQIADICLRVRYYWSRTERTIARQQISQAPEHGLPFIGKGRRTWRPTREEDDSSENRTNVNSNYRKGSAVVRGNNSEKFRKPRKTNIASTYRELCTRLKSSVITLNIVAMKVHIFVLWKQRIAKDWEHRAKDDRKTPHYSSRSENGRRSGIDRRNSSSVAGATLSRTKFRVFRRQIMCTIFFLNFPRVTAGPLRRARNVGREIDGTLFGKPSRTAHC